MKSSFPEDRGPRINATTYVFLVLSTIAVGLRFWSRHVAHRAGFWWDDWLILVTLPLYWSLCGLGIYWVSIGLGKHIENVPQPHSQIALVLFITNFIYNTSLSLVKLSVLMFYVRIFQTVKLYRMALWIVGFVIVGWWIAIDFVALLSCIPVQKAWNSKVPGHCLDSPHTFLGATITNIIADLLLLIVPIPMLWRLHIGTRRKIGLLVVFIAGYCVVILSILRLVSVASLGDSMKEDISWNLGWPSLLVICEVGVAIVSSCLPSIFNLAKHAMQSYLPKLSNKVHDSHPLTGPGGSHIGQIGNPIEETNKKGFVQLQNRTNRDVDSEERLFVNPGIIGVDNYGRTTTLAVKTDHLSSEGTTVIPMHKIHVQNEFDVER